jgi:hypothetical protein
MTVAVVEVCGDPGGGRGQSADGGNIGALPLVRPQLLEMR